MICLRSGISLFFFLSLFFFSCVCLDSDSLTRLVQSFSSRASSFLVVASSSLVSCQLVLNDRTRIAASRKMASPTSASSSSGKEAGHEHKMKRLEQVVTMIKVQMDVPVLVNKACQSRKVSRSVVLM